MLAKLFRWVVVSLIMATSFQALSEEVLPKITRINESTVEVEVGSFQDIEVKVAIKNGLEFLLKERLSNHLVVHEQLLSEAFNKPESYLIQYHYLNGEKKRVKINYNLQTIGELVEKVTDKIWSKQTIEVLFWLVLPNNIEEIVNQENIKYRALRSKIKELAREKGIKIIFPLWDFQDQENLQGYDIYRLNLDKIKDASKRYNSNLMVIGSLNENLEGNLLIFSELEKRTLTLNGKLDELWKVLNELVTYNEISVAQISSVNLTVQNVQSLEQYKQLENYLMRLSPLIKKIIIVQVLNQELVLSLEVVGGEEQLKNILENQESLVKISDNSLKYRL